MSAFGDAFAAARRAGKKIFDFNGKKYTTERADEKAADKQSASDRAAKAADDAKTQAAGDKYSATAKAASNVPAGTSDATRKDLENALKSSRKGYETAANTQGARSAAAKAKYDATDKAERTMPSETTPAVRKDLAAAKAKAKADMEDTDSDGMKCGGRVKKYAKGGSIDGCASKGKTRGRMC